MIHLDHMNNILPDLMIHDWEIMIAPLHVTRMFYQPFSVVELNVLLIY